MNKPTRGYGWEHELKSERSWSVPERRLPSVPVPPAHSEADRAQASERDKTLSPLVPPWIASLPMEAKPVFLCERYARIANRLAMCWPDAKLALGLLDEYFVDTRGTRRGFPPEALRELTALRQFARRRVSHSQP
ncbi:MAG TPA: hypothetical protein VGM74_09800 [Burkholderiaceae bacterium]|jgi:hypothetical protein